MTTGNPSRTTRRHFLAAGSLATAAALAVPRDAWSLCRQLSTFSGTCSASQPDDPDLKALAARALDAALSAGARYADVRFTRTLRQQFGNDREDQRAGLNAQESEAFAVGIRVLVKGTWGFASHAELTPEAMEWLGRSATSVGQTSAWPHVPPIELGERVSSVGSWEMPVKRDPFTVELEEKEGVVARLASVIGAEGGLGFQLQANFERQERTFVSTEGAFTRQTVYCTFGTQTGNADHRPVSGLTVVGKKNKIYRSPMVSAAGQGFELFEPLIANAPQMVERAAALLNAEKFDAPGRYPVVFDADAMAALVGAMGQALEIDRALGYESLDGGGSFLAPPTKILGTTPLPAPVTIMADRTMPGGAATVKWDDDGVATQSFPLISNGVVTDYATSREFIPEVAAWYRQQARPLWSHGCSIAESAAMMPVVQTPNLTLQPGTQDRSFDDLVREIDNGFAVIGGRIMMDEQLLTGFGDAAVLYSVKKGKLVGAVESATYYFRIPELWKGLLALGGAQTRGSRGYSVRKGQPAQVIHYTVQAVAALFKDVTFLRRS